MVLVDVNAFILDRVYNFELDENVPVEELTSKIVALITNQEQMKAEHVNEMFLYVVEQGKLLNRMLTLSQQGVRDGSELVLC